MKKKRFKFVNQRLDVQWNEAAESEPVEMMIYDAIGKDPWDGTGMTAADFRNAMAVVPRNRELKIRVNSKGGDVHEGMAIRNTLQDWPKKITTVYDGIAASTSSWAFVPNRPGDEVQAFKNSQVFIHDAIAFGMGNADDFRDAADKLDKTSDQIAEMYADKTGKRDFTMRQMMKEETLLTGEEAEELGLVDTIIEGPATRNFIDAELVKMKNQLATFYNSLSPQSGEQPNQTIMNKQKIVSLLIKNGVKTLNGIALTDSMTEAQLKLFTDEHLEAALNKLTEDPPMPSVSPTSTNAADIEALRLQVSQLTEANNAARTLRITNGIAKLVGDDKITESERPAALARALKDDTYLNELEARPANRPGAAPLSSVAIECVSEKFADVQNHLLDNGPRFSRNFVGSKVNGRLEDRMLMDVRDRAIIVTNTYRKHRKMMQEMYNSNTIDADLQRIVLLQEMLEEFSVPLLALQNFSVVFQNVPLEGTDKVGVPFYPLQTATANSWAAATGYAAGSMSNSTTNIREVAVGGTDAGGDTGSSAATGTAKDRKWLGLSFDSYTLRRQPFFNAQKLANQNANKLAVDIFKDIISRVVTTANYGASVKAVPAAAFTSADVADLYGSATAANWPARNRALVLDHTFNVALLKDNTFKQYLSYGATDPLRKAMIQQAYGFEDISIVPNLTNYAPAGQTLVGWINWLYAMLVATAPIMPAPEVRALLSRYDIVTDPKTGISFEYRQFGDPVLDTAKYICECSYGANIGVASALKRITSS